MATTREVIYRESVETLFQKNPGWSVPFLRRHRALHARGELNRDFLLFAAQHAVDIYHDHDLFTYGRLCDGLRERKAMVVTVEVGATPGPDQDEAGNSAKLQRIQSPFKAECYGGINEHGDGFVEWAEPVFFFTGIPTKPYVVNPGRVALEIGTTTSSRTALHLKQEMGLARWPYGETKITIFIMVEHPFFGSRVVGPVPDDMWDRLKGE